jgi:hypothetical protein
VLLPGWLRERLRPWKDVPPSGSELGLDPADVLELAEMERRLWLEERAASTALVAATVHRLVVRRVPARSVQPGPLASLAVMGFADGTRLLVRSLHAGDLGKVAIAVLGGHVTVHDCLRSTDSVLLELDGCRTVRIAAAGLAQ